MTDGRVMLESVPANARDLLDSAWQGISYAQTVADVNLRYSLAHRCALRTAAAVLAIRATPVTAVGSRARARKSRPQSAWVLLHKVAPEMGEWADYFATHAPIREAAEAGSSLITARMADDAIRDALAFMRDVVALAAGSTAGCSVAMRAG